MCRRLNKKISTFQRRERVGGNLTSFWLYGCFCGVGSGSAELRCRKFYKDRGGRAGLGPGRSVRRGGRRPDGYLLESRRTGNPHNLLRRGDVHELDERGYPLPIPHPRGLSTFGRGKTSSPLARGARGLWDKLGFRSGAEYPLDRGVRGNRRLYRLVQPLFPLHGAFPPQVPEPLRGRKPKNLS